MNDDPLSEIDHSIGACSVCGMVHPDDAGLNRKCAAHPATTATASPGIIDLNDAMDADVRRLMESRLGVPGFRNESGDWMEKPVKVAAPGLATMMIGHAMTDAWLAGYFAAVADAKAAARK